MRSKHRITLRFLLDQANAEASLLEIRELFGHGQVNLRGKSNGVSIS